MSLPILQLQNITKRYGAKTAVDNVSFEVPRGSIFGLLGPNGAGKTSLIRTITSITYPDSGQIIFDGEPLGAHHPQKIGYMPEERGLYKKMKVGEHLRYLVRLRGMSASEARTQLAFWYDRFDIADWEHKRIDELSKGMQQKVQFITTVMHRPQLLILDEPFSGLDPVNTNLIKDEIDRLHRGGTSIIFSTHRMEQVEAFCEYLVLINHGRNVLEGSMTAIKNRFKRNHFELHYDGELPAELLGTIQVIQREPGRLTFGVAETHDSNDFLAATLRSGVLVHSFREILPTLNEIFIQQVREVPQPTSVPI